MNSLFYMKVNDELCIVNFNEFYEENCFVDLNLGFQGQSSFFFRKDESFKSKRAMGIAHVNPIYFDSTESRWGKEARTIFFGVKKPFTTFYEFDYRTNDRS